MRILYYHICIILLLLTGCRGWKVADSSLIDIDLRIAPQEKQIHVEDIADVSYLQLALDEEFLFTGMPTVITDSKIIISQYTGDVFVFSREGEPLLKFNRRGSGPDDYSSMYGLVYDEEAEELFVASNRSIMVYSTDGEFKRRLPIPEGAYINEMVSFDTHTLLLYDDYGVYPSPFSLISKVSGEVVDTVSLPRDSKVSVRIIKQDAANVSILQGPTRHIVRHSDRYLLTDYSLDTVFFFSRDKQLSPALVRKPSIQSMDPVVYLNSFISAGEMSFMQAVTVKDENGRLPRVWLMYDRSTGFIYRPTIIMEEYEGKVLNLSVETIASTSDSRLGLIVLSLDELQEAYDDNKLSGELKRIVERSEDDGNDIYLFLHFK
jgi:hypothetical protein